MQMKKLKKQKKPLFVKGRGNKKDMGIYMKGVLTNGRRFLTMKITHGYDIVERAQSLRDCAYWYGGKRQKASKELADVLKKQNPTVWTDTYYNTALKDIDGIRRVCDCSGLVCYAYDIPDIGSSQIRQKFKVWNGKPRPGMIAWKQGHVGIIKDSDGHVIEMRSQKYDYMETRYRKEAGLMTLLYDPSIDYDVGDDIGWHQDTHGWWYRWKEGKGADTYIHDCIARIKERYYVFDSDGYVIGDTGGYTTTKTYQ